MNPASNAQLAPEPPTIEEQLAAGVPAGSILTLPDRMEINWQAIREEYRAALISNVAIAAKHGISEGAIRRRAKLEHWPRDLSAAVAVATRDKLARATRLDPTSTDLVDASNPTDSTSADTPLDSADSPSPLRSGPSEPTGVRTSRARRPGLVLTDSRPDPRTDDEIVGEAAEVGAAVVLSHRRDIREQRQLVSLLLSQLSDVAVTRGTLGEMISANVPATHHSKRIALEKACSLPSHAAIMRDLTTAQRHLVVLERQAFNIGQETHGGSLEDWLDKLDP